MVEGRCRSTIGSSQARQAHRSSSGPSNGRATPPSRLPDRFRPVALRLLDVQPDGDRLNHGDYHPGNVLLSTRGPVVIDWTNATRGTPTADHARTFLTLRLGESPPGVSAVIRYGERFGRRFFLQGYARSYRRHGAVDDTSVEAWMVAHAAARFAEGIEGEYPSLTRYLEERAPR